jgi:hypothetical protein
MPTAEDEFEPPDDLIHLLLASEVFPRLASFESDGCPKLFAKTFIAVREFRTLIGVFGSSGKLDIQSNGELRMRTRKTLDENRIVWRVESLFPNVMPSTGFVGFDSSGDAKLREGKWIVRPNAWRGKYNVDHWHGWK